MLIIDTYLDKTENKGIGLFTTSMLRKGQVISLNEEVFTKVITVQDYLELVTTQREFFDTYAIFRDNDISLDLDNLRFMNHSDNPNVSFDRPDDIGYTLKDIMPDEELTCDYRELDGKINFINKE